MHSPAQLEYLAVARLDLLHHEHMAIRGDMEPTEEDYAQAEHDWNEEKSIGFDELDIMEQYVLACSVAERKDRND